MTMPSFSLVGALEFRSVVSSLQLEAAGSSLGAFEPLLTPYPGGHYHGFSHSRSRSRGGVRSGSVAASDTSSEFPLNDRSPLPPAPSLPVENPDPSLPEASPLIHTDSDAQPRIPDISHTPASPRSDTDSDVVHQTLAARRQGVRLVLAQASHILFPTLHEFHTKSLLGKIASIFAAPSVLALTVTLPVVVKPYDSFGYRHEKAQANTLSTFEEEGIERTLIAEEEVLEEMQELQFNKWLTAVQCILGPLFCAAVLLSMLIYLGLVLE
jgi:sodium/potassium/calcium exchanger 6